MPKRVSTVRGREFGAGVRAAIESTGLPSREIARIMGCDEAKVSNVLNGKGGFTQIEVAQLLGVCRTPAPEVAHLMDLFPMRHHGGGWWQEHGTCPPVMVRTAFENLQVVETLVSWHATMVPFFLQTADYIREVLRASATIPADELEERAKAHLAMQRALPNSARRLFFIHESALRLQVGSPEMHAWQMQHLAVTANQPNTTIRIVPAARGAHAGMAGPFTLLTFGKYAPLVWVELENSSLFAEAEDAVKGYDTVVSALMDTSLDEDESKALIAELSESAWVHADESASLQAPSVGPLPPVP
ncbi:Scr1 family TA system antitoxin-like transcriptional regulator [Lentzea sp. CC55]|uniref:Scr1 family TA system antitoxin-like transcriptional regulator n=1 Tax=Lentzea sp. CC55 TaxID=2884909 RepID=UPI001F27B2BE|nr:Scr1 family TA system antitoxin-like transcriptional regulator [Lentzea sp. CC55]MCG8924156.1 helix-turn-helix domain-containing protein [Lentzea sp. CC55]